MTQVSAEVRREIYLRLEWVFWVNTFGLDEATTYKPLARFFGELAYDLALEVSIFF